MSRIIELGYLSRRKNRDLAQAESQTGRSFKLSWKMLSLLALVQAGLRRAESFRGARCRFVGLGLDRQKLSHCYPILFVDSLTEPGQMIHNYAKARTNTRNLAERDSASSSISNKDVHQRECI